MHYAVKKFIREVRHDVPYKFRLRTVLEVGAHNINGSPRKYFWFCNYTGVDISKGRGVDIVGKFSEVKLHNEYQVVISTEALEHDQEWEKDLELMYNKLGDGGLLIITCASNERPEHGTNRSEPNASPDTNDYYKNISKEDFRSVLSPDMFSAYILQYARGENDLQFWGIKKQAIPLISQLTLIAGKVAGF